MYCLLTSSELLLKKDNISFQELQELNPIFLLQLPGYQLLAYSKAYQTSCNGTALVNDFEFDCVPLPSGTNINDNIDTSKFSKLHY
jgi:hypothetical protein